VPVQTAVLSRPVLATALAFGSMVALFAVCTPLVPEVEPVKFFGGGVAYCLFLSLYVVGLLLAGWRPFHWWILSGVVPLIGTFGFFLWLLLGPDPDTFFWVLRWIAPGLLAVLAAYLLAGLVIAGWGWVRHVRGYWRASAAEPGAPPDRAGG
jgi:hypothetical protein